ncbi:MAG: GLPGLI family protein [Bacteroidetes bacterium]|nr:GLPGLI family protein [Bacteroidota bacterium]
MRKSFIITLLFIFCYLSYAQHSLTEINYKVRNNIKVTEKLRTSDADFINNISDEMEKLTYVLLFHNSESFFSLIEEMNADNGKYQPKSLGQSFSFTGKVYTNYKEGIMLHEKYLSSDHFLIKSYIKDIGWELSNETKNISGYTCYKAKTVDTIVTIRGLKTFEVIAWYAPKLPYSFGPANYTGLPGLILELETNKATFYADKILFEQNHEINLIKKPLKGKLISKDEYHEFERKGFEKYKQYIKN